MRRTVTGSLLAQVFRFVRRKMSSKINFPLLNQLQITQFSHNLTVATSVNYRKIIFLTKNEFT
jgi:capsid portal protein